MGLATHLQSNQGVHLQLCVYSVDNKIWDALLSLKTNVHELKHNLWITKASLCGTKVCRLCKAVNAGDWALVNLLRRISIWGEREGGLLISATQIR